MNNKPTWQLAEQICEVPAVDEAIRTFVEDNTGDNAIGLVLTVLAHQAATEAAKATGTAGEQWKPKALQGPRKSIFYGGNTNEHLNPLVVLISAEDYEKCCSLCEAPRVPHEMAYTVGGVADVSYVNGWNDCRDTVLGKIDDDPTNAPAEAARQPAPALPVKTWQERFGAGWPIAGTDAQIKARDEEIAELREALACAEGNFKDLLQHDALAATAAPVLSEADERDNEIFELQKALAFWLPQVNQFMSDEMSQRIAHDAYMLVIDGNLPDDFKTAQELGWILPATGKVQRDAEMVCGNCMEPIPATVMDTSSTRAPAVALSDESIDELAKPLMEQCVIVYGDMRRFARAIAAEARAEKAEQYAQVALGIKDSLEARLAEIQRGVEGLLQYIADHDWGGIPEPVPQIDALRILLQPQGQVTGCTHNCNQGRDCTCG